MTLEGLRAEGEAPEWMTQESLSTLSRGYLLEGETPRGMYDRLAHAASVRLGRPELERDFFEILWKNWLCPSSPVCSNFGTTRGLPISCFGSAIPDSVDGIFRSYHESAMLSKNGGGLGHYWGDIRPRGADITGNGSSEGIVPWLKVEDSVIASVSQGGVRRGSSANYLDVRHGDIEEFIDIRRQTGDETRRCRSIGFHHAVIFDDGFMQDMLAGGKQERHIWSKFLKARWEMGEPYAMFSDNANRDLPEPYRRNGLRVRTSQLCSEIFLYADVDHTFVCCLSSMNLARYDEWKNTQAVQLAVWFLDAVMEEFIQEAEHITGMEKAVRFARKSRPLGLGVLGWHSLLQSKQIPFESFQAMSLNNEIFRLLDEQSLQASEKLALEYGEPEWCRGCGVRNSHRLAVAPTLSNSIISGGLSEGIQPIVANVYANRTAKGTFLRRNPTLEALLEKKGRNTQDVWNQINSDRGSVRNLDFLSAEEKAVFLTAREISQFALVRQAAQRQKYIDQGQSLNLFFASPTDTDEETRKKIGRYFHQVHVEAWESGLKSLYYARTESPLRGESVFRSESDCMSCEG
jgi:ribonucleoside-diphosphate reductase alpha chain